MPSTAMLSGSAGAFVSTSKQVKKKMWWKNTKMTVILTIFIIAILIAIIGEYRIEISM